MALLLAGVLLEEFALEELLCFASLLLALSLEDPSLDVALPEELLAALLFKELLEDLPLVDSEDSALSEELSVDSLLEASLLDDLDLELLDLSFLELLELLPRMNSSPSAVSVSFSLAQIYTVSRSS